MGRLFKVDASLQSLPKVGIVCLSCPVRPSNLFQFCQLYLLGRCSTTFDTWMSWMTIITWAFIFNIFDIIVMLAFINHWFCQFSTQHFRHCCTLDLDDFYCNTNRYLHKLLLSLVGCYSSNFNRSTIYFQISKIMLVATTIKLNRTYRSAHVFPGEEVWQLRTDPDYQLQISVPSETRPRAQFACTEVVFWSQKFRAPSFAPQGRMTLLNFQQVYPFVALQVSERTIWRLVCRSWF